MKNKKEKEKRKRKKMLDINRHTIFTFSFVFIKSYQNQTLAFQAYYTYTLNRHKQTTNKLNWINMCGLMVRETIYIKTLY